MSSIDLTEVRQLFIEESLENLDVMESGLLDLEIGNLDHELLNSIFRAAHSIKGGAGIFKLEKIIHFAHTAEALLDEIRNEEHVVTQTIIDLLLESVDVLRLMMQSLQDDTENPDAEMLTCQTALEQMLKTPLGQPFIEPHQYDDIFADTHPPDGTAAPPAPVENLPAESSAENTSTAAAETHNTSFANTPTTPSNKPITTWQIVFKPDADLLKTGNDPINLFRELGQLGELTITPNIGQLPDFKQLDPHTCYLAWELILRGDVQRSDIEELFEWVEDDCELAIIPLEQIPAATPLETTDNTHFTESESTPVVTETADSIATDKPATEMVTELAQASIEVPPSPPVEPTETQSTTQTETAEPIPKVTKQHVTEEAATAPQQSTVMPAQDLAHQLAAKAQQIAQPKPEKASSHNEANSIRVGIDKIDDLINIVGELVITQSMLEQVSGELDEHNIHQLSNGLAQLQRNTRELQESVMRIRMLPISVSFNRFPRLVHDLSKQLHKKVELRLSGEHTELDKTVLEKMSDPLVHLVRNALDHGIESPEVRRAAGKPETGVLHLHAFHQGGNIIIQISDDGAGFNLGKIRRKAIEKGLLQSDENLTDEQLYEFIFHPGFSTTDQVSDLSGRGVGMDVVRKNIRALGGNIEVKSSIGQGTTFNIRLPLTLAILDGQLVRVGSEVYIISLLSIVESLRANPRYINSLAGQADIYKLRDEYIPILRLYQLFDVTPDITEITQGLLVIVEGEGQKMGLFVDELLSQQQIVIKSLETNYKQIQGISGATILGDGSVALILDIVGLIHYFHSNQRNATQFKPQAVGAV